MTRNSILSSLKPGEQLVFLVLVFLIAGLVSMGISMGMSMLFYQLPWQDILQIAAGEDAAHTGVLKLMQIITGFGNYIGAALLLSWFFTGSWTEWFKGEKRVELGGLILAAAMIVVSIPLVNYITEFNREIRFPSERLQVALENMEEKAEQLTWMLTGTKSFAGLLVNILMIALIPGIGEELIFRGLLQRILGKAMRNDHLAVLFTAIIFSALHLQFLSFLPRFFLGLILGYLFLYGKSIWYPIVAHTTNNLLGVLYYYVAHKRETEGIMEELGTSGMFSWSAVLSLVLLAGLFYGWLRLVNSATQSGSYQKD